MVQNSLVLTILTYAACVGLLMLSILMLLYGISRIFKYRKQLRGDYYGSNATDKEEIIVSFVWFVASFIVAICIDFYIIH